MAVVAQNCELKLQTEASGITGGGVCAVGIQCHRK